MLEALDVCRRQPRYGLVGIAVVVGQGLEDVQRLVVPGPVIVGEELV